MQFGLQATLKFAQLSEQFRSPNNGVNQIRVACVLILNDVVEERQERHHMLQIGLLRKEIFGSRQNLKQIQQPHAGIQRQASEIGRDIGKDSEDHR